MRIILCDDDRHFLQKLRKMVEAYLARRRIPCTITTFTSGVQLLSHGKFQFDLIFLDIRMNELDGIEVAKILRERNPRFSLVFVSGFIDHAADGYPLNAVRYLVKDKMDVLFHDAMDAALGEQGVQKSRISVEFVGRGDTALYTDDILYLESDLHVVYYHLTRGRHYVYGKLDAIQDALPADEFLRIHKSYLVNLRHLREVKGYTAYAAGDLELPISQQRYNEVKRIFLMYKGKA